jgi:hypothetical protein
MTPQGEPSTPWLPFAAWLESQRAAEEAEQPSPAPAPGGNGDDSAPPSEPSSSDDASPPSPSRPSRSSVASSLARDCRMETRLLDGCARGRQDMSIMLAAPGMPLHKSPLVSTRQATALLAALWEPLVQVGAGRLTRRLDAPTMLRPTEDRGVLSLWLLPNDDLSLVWQGRAPASDAPTTPPAAGADPAVRSIDRAGCEITVWEELARFPAQGGAHLSSSSDDPIITIHMLRGDTSGRSFYIRPRKDTAVAAHAVEAAATAAAAASGEVEQPLQALEHAPEGATVAAAAAVAADMEAAEEGRRMYFWLTGPDLVASVRSLGRLKSLVKRPPTLARRSGVPPRQLAQISSWLAQLDAAAHKHGAVLAGAHGGEAVATVDVAGAPTAAADGGSMAALLGRQVHSLPAARALDGAGGRLAATGAVSATAAALYRDRRFRLSFPCSVTVGASVALTGGPADATVAGADAAAKALSAVATSEAKTTAEEVARRTVDRVGRRTLEEAICEGLIRSVRAQRARAKAAASEQRERAARAQQAQQAQPLIRRAVEHALARGGTPPQSCKVQMALQVAAAAPNVPPLRCPAPCDESDAASTGSASSPRRATSESADTGALCYGSPGGGEEVERPSAPPPQPGRVTIDDLETLLGAPTRSESDKVTIAELPELLSQGQQQQPTPRAE